MSDSKPIRWWPLVGVLLLLVAGILFFQLSGGVDVSLRNPLTILSLMLGFVLSMLWLVFFSRMPWIRRGISLGAVIGLVVIVAAVVRVDGWDGDMFPQLGWRWSAIKDRQLPSLLEQVEARELTPLEVDGGPEDYPRFLGKDGRATVTNIRLETDWSSHPPKKAWSQPVGAGWSAYAVVGDAAVTQEQRGDTELVACYDRTTGSPRWAHGDPVRFSEALGGDGPRATPNVVDGRVYALGATGILNCIELASGELVWSLNVLTDNDSPNLTWAKSSSPLVYDDLVVVSLGERAEPSLAAYDRKTGERRWTAGKDKASYATPILATLAGKRQVVVVNAHSVTGHEPATGEILWEFAWPGEQAKCSQPVPVGDDRLYLCAGYGVGSVLLRLKAEEGKLSAEQLWQSLTMKTRFTNVVVKDGFVYGLDDGILVCQDLETGKHRWKGMRYGHGQVMLLGETLLVVGEWGKVALVAANPERFEEYSRMQMIEGKTWNNPVVSGRYLLVRNAEEAACYELALKAIPAE